MTAGRRRLQAWAGSPTLAETLLGVLVALGTALACLVLLSQWVDGLPLIAAVAVALVSAAVVILVVRTLATRRRARSRP